MSKYAENLEKQLGQTLDKRERIDLINELAFEYKDDDIKKFESLTDQAHELAQSIGYEKGVARSLSNYGLIEYYRGHAEKTISNIEKAIKIFKKWQDNIGLANAYCIISNCYWVEGRFDKSLSLLSEAATCAKDSNHNVEGWVYMFQGNFHHDLKDFDIAIGKFQTAIEIFERLDYEVGLGRTLNSMSNSLIETGQYDLAEELSLQALKIHDASGYDMGVARSYYDLGCNSIKKNDYPKALKFLHKSLELRENAKSYHGAISCCEQLGQAYCLSGYHEIAIEMLDNGERLAHEIHAKAKLINLWEVKQDVYKQLKNFELAYEFSRKAYELKSEVLEHNAKMKLDGLENMLLAEKKEREAEVFKLKHVELKKLYDNIRSSINYARRIQSAILPSDVVFNEAGLDAFILYKPKDIVSGDFYWAKRKGNKLFVAAVDCTGHGVPGALVSIVGYNFLNRILDDYELDKPSEILDSLTVLVEESFNNKKSEDDDATLKDGMDIALCCFDLETHTLQYSGAHNPLYIARDSEMIVVKADRQAVGASKKKRKFTNHTIEFRKNDTFYIFSDGYKDQFGGPNGRKFMAKRFRNLLNSVQEKSIKEQEQILTNTFVEWKGVEKQTDDICLIGMKYTGKAAFDNVFENEGNYSKTEVVA